MATIIGGNGADTIRPGFVSLPGVTPPGADADSINGLGGSDSLDGGGGNDSLEAELGQGD